MCTSRTAAISPARRPSNVSRIARARSASPRCSDFDRSRNTARSAPSAVSLDLPGMLGLHSPHPRQTIHSIAYSQAACLVDRVHETLFPEQLLDWQRDVEILAASRWPTLVSLAQFWELTGESAWPDELAPWIRHDVLEYFCNGQVDYRLRGIH